MKQAQALQVMMNGHSVFLTGPPGAGKSYVLGKFVRHAQQAGKQVAVTASTGIAATHIGGMTIHSWSGLGVRDQLSERDIETLAARDKLVKRFASTDVLVIDEVSMLQGQFLNSLNRLAKRLRNSSEPFGGVQMILVGDMFQLPPVNRSGQAVDFAHQADAWNELNPDICYLDEQHRQTGGGLLELLEALRAGELQDFHYDILRDRIGVEPEDSVILTRLYAHNADVDSINAAHLEELEGHMGVYEMTSKGSSVKVDQLARGVLAPTVLELKIGAEVMFVANDFSKGFANGSRGRVVSLGGDFPVVRLSSNGREISVEPYTWQLVEDGKIRAEVSQLPLRLAWAITIHKSQGMSLDAAEIDLSRTFTPGMGYVALSRVRSLEGVYLKGINTMALQLHPDIFTFDKTLKQSSELLARVTEPFVEPTASVNAEPGAAQNEALLAKLKEWRRARAESEGVPLYLIAHNALLDDIATRMPMDDNSLLAVRGMGRAKLAKLGPEILTITTQFAGSLDTVKVSEAESAEVKSDDPYPRSQAAWTDEEDERLLWHITHATPLNEVCNDLERPPGKIWMHVAILVNR